MTPNPNDDALDREIDAALQDVDLQGMTAHAEEETRTAGGDRLYDGVIEGINGDDVIVDLGPRMQGVVSLREFDEPPEVGSKHKFTLRGREDDLWLLSMRDALAIAQWEELTVDSLVRARVSGQNQGGLELKIGKHDAFMPASQVSLSREDDISSYIGQTLTCQVLEIDRNRKRVVLSRRRILERERMEALSDSAGRLHPGVQLTGKVTRIESFGAFVDVGGGLEGLVHVSNISRKRVDDPNDVLTKGQEVQVQVLEIKEGGKRIGLGMKQLEPDPWDSINERLSVDRQITGSVTRLADFGAFVEVEPGLEGLLHVSQLGRERVRRASDVLKVGEEVTVRIQAIDESARRISLSRLDPRGALLGSDEAVESDVIDEVLDRSRDQAALGTNLGSLFKKALDDKKQ
ncbi:MAG: S1 RNA-binding domain-containing protein [bacterium]|nr:S1 RNA-binding domain-containing protein [bacterium]